MGNFLIFLSGARQDVLRDAQGDRIRFEGLGGAVLTTGLLAMVSMTFALHTALQVALLIAIAVAVVWGTAIISLDRWLVSSIQAETGSRIKLALPRFVLAILLGAVISTPFVLQIFKPEIDAKIVEFQQEDYNRGIARQAQGQTGRTIAQLQQQITANHNIVDSGGQAVTNPDQDPKIIGLKAQLTEANKASDSAYDKWHCQLYGPCEPKGPGPLAAAAEKVYKDAQARVRSINDQIEGRKRELTATDAQGKATRLDGAKTAVEQDQQQLRPLLAQQRFEREQLQAKTKANKGILVRLKALDEVSHSNGTMNLARILLFLLFMVIECLPVLVKLMQKPGNYERILALTERQELRAARRRLSDKEGHGIPGRRPSLEDIWERREGEDAGAPPPASSSRVTGQAGDADESDPGDTFEDQALRQMSDTRINGDGGPAPGPPPGPRSNPPPSPPSSPPPGPRPSPPPGPPGPGHQKISDLFPGPGDDA